MGDEAFDEKTLIEKLSKLNSSQQSIESLSKWCIPHRKRAKHVVENWEKIFKSAQHEQQVSLLYLSNDIMQNSRRKGSEFVNEFWKVLPTALKLALDSGHDNCRKVASRLMDIWEERKVFGSRGANLKNELLGKTPPAIINIVKTPNPIKVVKRDSTSLRIKLTVGGLPERILTAFQSVFDDIVNEESTSNKFHEALSFVQEIEKDVLNAASEGNMNASAVMDNIQKQENMILECLSELENSESIRAALVSQLKEALQEQESKLEQIRNDISLARGQIEQAANMRLQLSGNTIPQTMNQPKAEPSFSPVPPAMNTTTTVPAPPHPLMSFTKPSEEESKKATAAAVAAKLTASTSSAQMLTSILSSLVAEEAASMSGGLKRPRTDPPVPFLDSNNPDGPISNAAYFSASHQMMTNMPPGQPGSAQATSQVNPLQAPFHPPPPPPLPPANQFIQSNMMGMPFGYASSNLQPPLPPNAAMGFLRPAPPAQQVQLQQPQGEQSLSPQPPQQPTSGGFYRPIGIGFYGQGHQPPTPPIHRQ